MNNTTLQPLQDCNAKPCRIATVVNCRNAKVLCQNAIDLCGNVDPVHSLEGVSRKVLNGTGSPLSCRRNSHVL